MEIDFFKKFKVKAYISEREDGDMRLSKEKSNQKSLSNRKRFLKKSGLNPDFLVSTFLVHEGRVKRVGDETRGEIFEGYDAMISNSQDIFLSVTIADCLAIFFLEPQKKSVGIAHAGWKGLKNDIIRNVTVEMENAYMTKPEDLMVYISPALSLCHYEVGREMIGQFTEYKKAFLRRGNKTYINIKEIARLKLQEAGVKSENITISKECTYCEEKKFFSYRRDHYGNVSEIESMLAVIGMTGD